MPSDHQWAQCKVHLPSPYAGMMTAYITCLIPPPSSQGPQVRTPLSRPALGSKDHATPLAGVKKDDLFNTNNFIQTFG